MKHVFLTNGIVLALLLAQASPALAVDTNTPTCLKDVLSALGREQRTFRRAVFGEQKASDVSLHSVRYDQEGNVWVKTEENGWQSTAEGFQGTLWTNRQMDEQAERDVLCESEDEEIARQCVSTPRRGIVEVKKTPTSDLLPPMLQSLRALQCRLRSVCTVALRSQGAEEEEKITVQEDGCMEMQYPAFPGCKDAGQEGVAIVGTETCKNLRLQVLEREMQLITLTVSYDAAYRSLVQFMGMFEGFLLEFRFPLLEPLWQTVRTLGGFKNLPCFLSQCDE